MSRSSAILDAKLTYLYSKVGANSIKLEIETTRWILRAMGIDPEKLPCVHIAGTNGKGSVSSMVESVLRTAGIKTGHYTSPHLLRFNERIRVNGEMIPNDELSRLLDAVELADHTQLRQEGSRPGTFFELTTAVAFSWFLKNHVQLAVLETGLGGRLDSTNVVSPLVSVLTAVGLEHTNFLGTTIEKVTEEKAGIIKPKRPVVVGRQMPDAMKIIQSMATRLEAPIYLADEHASVRCLSFDEDGQTVAVETADGVWPSFRLPLLGNHQLENCAIAITTLEVLRNVTGWPIPPEAIREGLEKTVWPARCQVIRKDPLFLLDVAHNPHGATALAEFLKTFKRGRPLVLICGLLEDKDADQFFRNLRPVVDACLLVPLDSIRNMHMERLIAAAQRAGLHPVESILPAALRSADKWARENNGMILAAGSFYLASDILYQLDVPI